MDINLFAKSHKQNDKINPNFFLYFENKHPNTISLTTKDKSLNTIPLTTTNAAIY